jgi:caffeoyl-CoA O-methyltransferase
MAANERGAVVAREQNTSYVRSMLGPRAADLEDVLREALLSQRLVPMQVDDNAARLLQMLTELQRPARALEIGTYFGYSAIHIARGLAADGQLTTIEIDPKMAAIARRNFKACRVADRIDLVVADATEHLNMYAPESFELIFIDGEKGDYPLYLKLCTPLLAPGGLLIADDAFADGNFEHEVGGDHATAVASIKKYVRYVCRSPKLFSAFIGTTNGMVVSRRVS